MIWKQAAEAYCWKNNFFHCETCSGSWKMKKIYFLPSKYLKFSPLTFNYGVWQRSVRKLVTCIFHSVYYKLANIQLYNSFFYYYWFSDLFSDEIASIGYLWDFLYRKTIKAGMRTGNEFFLLELLPLYFN